MGEVCYGHHTRVKRSVRKHDPRIGDVEDRTGAARGILDVRVLQNNHWIFAAEFHPCLSTYARLCEYEKMDDTRYKEAAFEHTWRIGSTLERVLDVASSEKITTAEAADHIAEERLLR